MTREEFHRAYKGTPEGFRAELIGGFPGLWISAQGLVKKDFQMLLDVLQAGLKTPEHEAFVQRLAAARRPHAVGAVSDREDVRPCAHDISSGNSPRVRQCLVEEIYRTFTRA